MRANKDPVAVDDCFDFRQDAPAFSLRSYLEITIASVLSVLQKVGVIITCNTKRRHQKSAQCPNSCILSKEEASRLSFPSTAYLGGSGCDIVHFLGRHELLISFLISPLGPSCVPFQTIRFPSTRTKFEPFSQRLHLQSISSTFEITAIPRTVS